MKPSRLQTALMLTLLLVPACGAAATASNSSRSAQSPHPVNSTIPGAKPPATPRPSPKWGSSNSEIAILCPDLAFRPGGKLDVGTNPCHVTLGAHLLAADCTQGAIPGGISIDSFDQNTGAASAIGTVVAVPGTCQLSTPSKDVQVGVQPGDASLGPSDEPGSLVVIADFVPAPDSLSETSIDVRCSPSGTCITVGVVTNGNYVITEGDTYLLTGNLDSGGLPGGLGLNLNSVNRLVLNVTGGRAAAWLNGRILGSGPITRPDQPGPIEFRVSSGDSSRPVAERLMRLYAFQSS